MSQELDEFKKEVQKTRDKNKISIKEKPIIGLGLAMTAFFLVLVLLLLNVTATLGRRSPFMEYSVCFNERLVEDRQAESDIINAAIPGLTSGQPVIVSQEQVQRYLDSQKALREAHDFDSKDACPGLDIVNPDSKE